MPPLCDLYAMAHTAPFKKAKVFTEDDLDHPESFTNISSHNKLMRYKDFGKATKGDDFNPSQSPFDPELVMLFGDGRKHGSVAIGDGLIHCPRSLPEIKKRQMKSLPEMRPQPQPMDLAVEARAQELVAEATRQVEEKVREMEERTTNLLEAERNQNDASQWGLYEILVVSFSCILAKSCTQCSFHY